MPRHSRTDSTHHKSRPAQPIFDETHPRTRDHHKTSSTETPGREASRRPRKSPESHLLSPAASDPISRGISPQNSRHFASSATRNASVSSSNRERKRTNCRRLGLTNRTCDVSANYTQRRGQAPPTRTPNNPSPAPSHATGHGLELTKRDVPLDAEVESSKTVGSGKPEVTLQTRTHTSPPATTTPDHYPTTTNYSR